MLKKQIMRDLKQSGIQVRKLPSDIIFSALEDRSVLTMTMSKAKLCGLGKDHENMQKDGAAFEAWALALYTHWMGRKGAVILDVDPSFTARLQDDQEFFLSNGHYGRFLYRALCFSSQYEWLKLSKTLSNLVAQFQKWLSDGEFVNNVGEGEAGTKNEKESRMETAFATGDKAPFLRQQLGLEETAPIYRQFPVGLFCENVCVFTGGRAAMDLWTICGDTLCTIELKAANQIKSQPKLGALSEIFFYSNYMYDLYVDTMPSVQLAPPKKNSKNDRGYSVIRNLSQQGELKQIEGILLLDPESRHPLMTPEVMETMNQSTRKGIQYRILSYEI